MHASDPVRLITVGQRSEGHQTAGMLREEAIAIEGLWAGFVRTQPEMSSEWHHHADNESVIYVVSGTLRLEFGAGGQQSIEAVAGDFVHVPTWAIHRETNPGEVEGEIVVFRAGEGPLVTNVDGPAPPADGR